MAAAPDDDLEQYIHRQLVDSRRPCWLRLDAQGRIVACGGDPQPFGLEPAVVGRPASELLPCLIGTLEGVTDEPLLLPLVENRSARPADLHLVPLREGWGVVLFDAAETHRQRQQDQQLAQQLRLLQRDQKMLLERLHRAQDELRRKNEELAVANQAKGRFIGGMSHELRTPLASILGYAGLLRDLLPDGGAAASYLGAMERGANYLVVMIDNLLSQAAIEASALLLDPRPTPLAPLFTELRELLEPLAARKGLALRIAIASGLPDEVVVDPLRLRQILINIAGNAIKYSAEGGVTIDVGRSRQRLLITVSDTGPGIPPEQQARIFEPFQQIPSPPHRPTSGAGLGLAISHELAVRMGGSLRLVSPPGGGSRFAIELPLETVTRGRGDSPAPTTSVLVVEDDVDLQRLLHDRLVAAGYRVQLCDDGLAAVQLALEQPPDLLLLDLSLPVVDGIEAAQMLRHQGFNGGVFALTADPSAGRREHALAAGCDDCFVKPLDLDRLASAITRLRARRERPA